MSEFYICTIFYVQLLFKCRERHNFSVLPKYIKINNREMITKNLFTMVGLMLLFQTVNAQINAVQYQLRFNETTNLFDCYLLIKDGNAYNENERIQFNNETRKPIVVILDESNALNIGAASVSQSAGFLGVSSCAGWRGPTDFWIRSPFWPNSSSSPNLQVSSLRRSSCGRVPCCRRAA